MERWDVKKGKSMKSKQSVSLTSTAKSEKPVSDKMGGRRIRHLRSSSDLYAGYRRWEDKALSSDLHIGYGKM